MVLVFTVSNSLDLKRLSLDIVDILMTILPNEVEVGWRCHVSISVTVALFFEVYQAFVESGCLYTCVSN